MVNRTCFLPIDRDKRQPGTREKTRAICTRENGSNRRRVTRGKLVFVKNKRDRHD